MKIMTFVKHVPTQAITPRIAESRVQIEEEGLSYEVNEADLYAIEEAIAQRTVHKGSVTAVTIGPARARETLTIAYAKGCDEGIHVIDETFRGTNPVLNVHAAAQIVRKLEPEMIFVGIQAEDDLQGQFGIVLAEVLGLPVVTAVTGINVDPAAKVATVVRELGAGLKEEIDVDLPCIVTVQFGIRQLRYLPVMSVFKMRSRPVETIAVTDLALSPAATQANDRMRILELNYPDDRSNCQLIDGSPDAAARALMSKLVDTGVL